MRSGAEQHDEVTLPETIRQKPSAPVRVLLLAAGWTAMAFGLIGIVLPVLPTTPFLLIAAWCFARTSPRFETWLVNHHHLGPPVRAWRKDRAIATRHKVLAIVMMASSFLLAALGGAPGFVLLPLGVVLGAVGLYLATRPRPPIRQ